MYVYKLAQYYTVQYNQYFLLMKCSCAIKSTLNCITISMKHLLNTNTNCLIPIHFFCLRNYNYSIWHVISNLYRDNKLNLKKLVLINNV